MVDWAVAANWFKRPLLQSEGSKSSAFIKESKEAWQVSYIIFFESNQTIIINNQESLKLIHEMVNLKKTNEHIAFIYEK